MKYAALLFLLLSPLGLEAQSYVVTGNTHTYQRLASPTMLTISDDELTGAISPPGFSFEYFGTTYTDFKVCSNGFIIMGSTGTTSSSIPFPSMTPGLTIAGLWRDHLPTQAISGDGIGWDYSGGVLTVEWDEVPTTGQVAGAQLRTPYCNMQITLNTATDVIEFRYGSTNMTNGGPPAGDNNWYTCGIGGPTNPAPQELIHGAHSPYIGVNGEYLQDPAGNYIRFEPQAAPKIVGTPVTDATVGQVWSYTFSVTGSPAPTISVTGLPAWLTVNGETISGTPDVADIGVTGVISIDATNTLGSDNQLFQITVVDTPPPGGGGGLPSFGSGGGSGCATAGNGQTWWTGFAILLSLAVLSLRRKTA